MKLTDNIYIYPEVGMMDCNTYIIKDRVGIIIDPGFPQYMPELVEELKKDGIKPEEIDVITNTHLHADHFWGNEAFKEISGARIVGHHLHQKFYDITVVEGSRLFGLKPPEFNADSYFDDSTLDTGELCFELIHAPGHSLDSICFYCQREKVAICGDIIFDQNTGRVDLPGGSADELKQSIEGLSKLEIEHLLPGHMGIVSGPERVKRNFDFVRENVFQWL